MFSVSSVPIRRFCPIVSSCSLAASALIGGNRGPSVSHDTLHHWIEVRPGLDRERMERLGAVSAQKQEEKPKREKENE